MFVAKPDPSTTLGQRASSPLEGHSYDRLYDFYQAGCTGCNLDLKHRGTALIGMCCVGAYLQKLRSCSDRLRLFQFYCAYTLTAASAAAVTLNPTHEEFAK
jgi:hypothetical protein